MTFTFPIRNLFVLLSLGAAPALAQVQELDIAPPAPAYTWSVTKTGSELVLVGAVPYASTADLLRGRAGEGAVTALTIKDGAPLGFARDAMRAIQAVTLLETGSVALSNGAWVVDGELDEGADRDALEAALGAVTGSGDPWRIAVSGTGSTDAVVDEPSAWQETAQDAQEVVSEPSSAEVTGEQSQEPTADAAVEGAQDAVGAEAAMPQAIDSDYGFSANWQDGQWAFAGAVPDRTTRMMLGNMATSLDAVQDLEIAPGAPPAFQQTAFAGLAAIEPLVRGAVELDDGQWRITGQAEIDTQIAAVEDTLARLGGETEWTVDIEAPIAADLCREQTQAVLDDRAVLFGSGSARLTSESEALLTDLAAIFAICPQTPVYVEGHTDAVGDAGANLVLSLSRAESVVDALVDLDIAPNRLYAAGYGASLPVASNDTAAGRAQNRRIVFSFKDIAGPSGESAQ